MSSTFDQVRAADARRRQSASEETETAIFEAAERLLGRMQLHDVSVARLTEEAMVSRATFYRYFTSKDAVVAGLLARVMDEVFEAIAGFVGAEAVSDPEAVLRAALGGGWSVWERHQPVMRAVSENWHRIPELEDLWLSIIDRFTDAIALQIDRERNAGRAPEGTDSRQLAAMLLWSTERLMYIAAGPRPGAMVGVDATLEPVAELWLRAVYGSAVT